LALEIKGFDAAIVRSGATIDRQVIEAADNLKVVGRAGVGVDNVDLEAASEKGVLVMNTPGGNTISTAEHTFSMLLAMSRNIPQAHSSLKAGRWEKAKFKGVEVYGKTLGIIGMGRIGTEVSKRAQAFQMKVLVYDPFITEDKAKNLNVESVELERLFRESDYITVHTPLNDKTRGLLDKKAFDMMKKGVRVLNCARGGIIDEDALYDAVKEGKVAGAAIDVYIEEPVKENKLLELDRITVTPHLGASTEEAQESVAIEIARQIAAYLKQGRITNAVNVPSLDEKMLSLLQPYMNLGKKLGSFIGQVIRGPLKQMEISYYGRVQQYELQPATSSVLEGFLSHYTSKPVNYVNASYIAKDKGISVIEKKSSREADFVDLIEVSAVTSDGTTSIAGTIFGAKNNPRIVRINEYLVEAVPLGTLLIIFNDDHPGVIGKIGSLLGSHSINITDMSYGRGTSSQKAITVLNLEKEIDPDVLGKFEQIEEITAIHLVRL